MELTNDVLDEIEALSGKVRVGDLKDYSLADRPMPRSVSVGELVAEVRRLRLATGTLWYHLNRDQKVWADQSLQDSDLPEVEPGYRTP